MQQVAGCSVFSVTSSDSSEEVFFFFFPPAISACTGHILWLSLLAHLVVHLELRRRLEPAWMNWVTVLHWQLLCVVTPSILFPTRSLSLPACPTYARCCFGWCCHGTVWPEWGFTYSILCSLRRGQLTRLRRGDAKTRSVRKQPCGDSGLSSSVWHSWGLPFTWLHSADFPTSGDLFAWFTDSFWPKNFFPFFFFLVGSCF